MRHERHVAVGHHVADEGRLAPAIGAHVSRHGPDAGKRGHRHLDLAQLDAEPPQLDLRIATPEVLDLARVADAADVARSIEARRPAFGGERIGDEALGAQLRAIEVAARDASPADTEFARDAARHELQMGVQHVRGQRRDRPADVGRAIGNLRVSDDLEGHVHRGLGDAEHVDQCRARIAGLPVLEPRGLQRLATEDHVAERERRVGPREFLLHEQVESAWHLVEHRHAPLREQRAVRCGVLRDGLRHHDQSATAQQGAVHLPYGEVERERVEHGPHVVLVEGELEAIVEQEAHDVPVLDEHPLRRASRSGGVDHVAEVVGLRGGRRCVIARLRTVGPRIRSYEAVEARPGEAGRKGGLGHDPPRGAVVEHERKPFIGIRRIERHVRAARLEHREQHRHLLDGLLHAHGDERVGADAAFA